MDWTPSIGSIPKLAHKMRIRIGASETVPKLFGSKTER
jgi:hypothetical protein